MAVPIIGGTYSAHLSSGGAASIDISSIPSGGWMVVSVMSSAASTTVTPPLGWSTLVDKEVSGTRANFLFIKIKENTDGTDAVFTQNNAVSGAYGLIWGTGSNAINNWVVGATWRRSASAEPAGSRVSNIAQSITTTTNDNLVLAISHEATLAMTASNEIASVTPSTGWTQRQYLTQVAVNDRIETIWMATKSMSSPASSGDLTVAYTSPQDNNGWTIQISIPSSEVVSLSPQVLGVPTAYLGNTTSGFSIAKPNGIINGDYIVVFVRQQSSTATVEPSAAGFNRLGPAFIANSASYRVNGFYGHVVTDASSEPGMYDFTFTTGAGNVRCIATAFIVRGVDVNDPIAGYYDSYSGTVITNGRQTEPYVINSSPVLGLFAAASEFASPNDHVPTGYPAGYSVISEQVTTTNLASSRTYLWVGKKELTTTPVDAASMTWGTPSGAAAETIALRGINSTDADLSGVGYTAANGSGGEVKVYHTTTNGPRTPMNVVPMRRGFNTVAESLAVNGVTWAHRGGSATYPEMSMYGYTQSVMRGYGVLEVSLARTSDGVWFGLHDATTDRTSGGTYGNASAQTWAQVQTQQNKAGPGSAQPYMRWDEIIATYGSTHVIVADPKYALGSYRTEFLNMVNNDLGPTKAIIKYSGIGSGAAGLAIAAQAMGFETWGFFYAGDASAAQGGNGNLQTWGPNWSLIGMEYGASQAIWDEALALGKPVIGHIAPNQAAYDMAMAKGASGVQTSGVGVVRPVSWWTQ